MKQLSCMLLWCLSLVAMVSHHTPSQAADVTPSSNVLAYTMDADCPSGWHDLSSDDKYKGRLIKGSTTDIGEVFGSAITDNSIPSHSHTSWSRKLIIGDTKKPQAIASSDRMLANIADFTITQAHGTVEYKNTNMQRKEIWTFYPDL